MTTPLAERASRGSSRVRRPVPRLAGAAACLVGLAALLVWAFGSTAAQGHVPLGGSLLYAAAFTALVLLPGLAAARALLPSPRTWAGLAGQAFGLGLVAGVLEWVAAVGTGLVWTAWVAAALVTAAGAVTALRGGRLLFRPQTRVNAPAFWAMLALLAVQAQRFANAFDGVPLLPEPSSWYQDNVWHLAINAELSHRLVPDLPQVAGEQLNYHWLANAHMALMHLVTDLPHDVVLTRLWYWPMLFAGAFIACAFAEHFSRRAWLGPVAGAAVLSAPSLHLSSWLDVAGADIWVPYSPSQTFAVPVLLFAAFLASLLIAGPRPLSPSARELREPGLPARTSPVLWATTGLVFLIAPGAKSSNLPMIGAAAALVLLVALVGRWPRRRVLSALGVGALAVAATLLTAPLFAGAGEGTGIQFGATIRRMPLWFAETHASPYFRHGPVLPGLSSPHAPLLLAVVLCAFVFAFGWAFAALGALTRRSAEPRESRSLVVWFAVGVAVAGFCAMLLIDHDGLSQIYFLKGATAVLGCGVVIGLDMLLDTAAEHASSPAARRRGALAVVLAGLAGAVVIALVRAQNPAFLPSDQYLSRGVVQALTALGVMALLAALAVASRRRRGRSPRLAAGVAAALLMAGTLAPVPVILDKGATLHDGHVRLSQDAVDAGRWVSSHTPADAVIATNAHCMGIVTQPNCDSRGFWVSALTERQAYIEGWGYSAEAHKAHGVGGRIYSKQPFHDSARFQENERAFSEADPAALQALKSRGVSYLLATTEASPVSPQLTARADEVFREGRVSVYRLR